jgi:hypothetical protein
VRATGLFVTDYLSTAGEDDSPARASASSGHGDLVRKDAEREHEVSLPIRKCDSRQSSQVKQGNHATNDAFDHYENAMAALFRFQKRVEGSAKS